MAIERNRVLDLTADVQVHVELTRACIVRGRKSAALRDETPFQARQTQTDTEAERDATNRIITAGNASRQRALTCCWQRRGAALVTQRQLTRRAYCTVQTHAPSFSFSLLSSSGILACAGARAGAGPSKQRADGRDGACGSGKVIPEGATCRLGAGFVPCFQTGGIGGVPGGIRGACLCTRPAAAALGCVGLNCGARQVPWLTLN